MVCIFAHYSFPFFVRAGTSYASSVGTPPVTPSLEERAHLGSWMGVPNPDAAPVKKSEAPESELDWGSKEEETQEDETPQAQMVNTEEVFSQPAGSVATLAGSENEEGEKEAPTALQKWFPYEAWWQKQVRGALQCDFCSTKNFGMRRLLSSIVVLFA